MRRRQVYLYSIIHTLEGFYMQKQFKRTKDKYLHKRDWKKVFKEPISKSIIIIRKKKMYTSIHAFMFTPQILW